MPRGEWIARARENRSLRGPVHGQIRGRSADEPSVPEIPEPSPASSPQAPRRDVLVNLTGATPNPRQINLHEPRGDQLVGFHAIGRGTAETTIGADNKTLPFIPAGG